jgi:hypothetical protein
MYCGGLCRDSRVYLALLSGKSGDIFLMSSARESKRLVYILQPTPGNAERLCSFTLTQLTPSIVHARLLTRRELFVAGIVAVVHIVMNWVSTRAVWARVLLCRRAAGGGDRFLRRIGDQVTGPAAGVAFEGVEKAEPVSLQRSDHQYKFTPSTAVFGVRLKHLPAHAPPYNPN